MVSAFRGLPKPILLYLGLAGLVAGGLAGWAIRAQTPAPVAPVSTPGPAPGPPRADQLVVKPAMVFTTTPAPLPATPELLPSGAELIYCWYRFPELPPGTSVSGRWWYNGKKLGAIGAAAQSPSVPSLTVPSGRPADQASQSAPMSCLTLQPPPGAKAFAPGIYEVELYNGSEQLGRGSFVMAEAAQQIMAAKPSLKGQTRVISCLTARSVNAKGEPQQPQAVFGRSDKVCVAFAYINGNPGGKLRVAWYFQGQPIARATQELAMKGGAGRGYAWLSAEGGGFPAGSYTVALFLPGVAQPLAQAGFTVRP